MKFIDEAGVLVFGGAGGAGVVHWRREKFEPRGGPDGGDGGNGGAVIFQTDPGLKTLIDFSFQQHLRAKNGNIGEANNRTGRNGKDLVCKLPVGTQVYYEDQLVADLSTPEACWIAARGGRGGKGNSHFKSASNQAPERADPGQAGEEFRFRLVLKSVADIGLVGLPNVGKSSLVAALSNAHPLVADYPFTTLRPSLGVCQLSQEKKFVIADIPGLIPGAHQGKGLGIQFLKHIERTSILLQLIDLSLDRIDADDHESLKKAAWEQYQLISQELSCYSESLAKRPRLVAISKSDLPLNQAAFQASKDFFQKQGVQILSVSSQSKHGLSALKSALWNQLQTEQIAKAA